MNGLNKESGLGIKSLVLWHSVEGCKGEFWFMLSAELQWQEYQQKRPRNNQKQVQLWLPEKLG